MTRVRLEVLLGLSNAFGVGGSNAVTFDKETKDGTTVGDVIRELAKEQEAFGKIIFDASTGKISDQVAIVLNDRLLEALKGLDTNIKDGDIIKFYPVVAGG